MNTGRTMRIVNPAGETRRPELTPAPRLRTLRGTRIGVIHNTKHMAGEFLAELQRLLKAEHGVESFEFYRKKHASVPTPADVMQRFIESCDAVVHGVAD